MDEREVKILTDRLIPVPRELEFRDGNEFVLKENCQVCVTIVDDFGVKEKCLEWFKLFWGVTPEVSVKHRLLKKADTPEA